MSVGLTLKRDIMVTQKSDAEATPPWDAARVNLTSKELAPGMFAVMPDDVLAKDHVGTTGGFVIGERGVLVIESMLNGDLASQLIGLVRQVTTKPIRFLVNTSYHGDHAYGNYLFPENAVVIQHPATKSYMEKNFEEDRRFMIGLMGKGKGMEVREFTRSIPGSSVDFLRSEGCPAELVALLGQFKMNNYDDTWTRSVGLLTGLAATAFISGASNRRSVRPYSQSLFSRCRWNADCRRDDLRAVPNIRTLLC
jgi:hypothetical protein